MVRELLHSNSVLSLTRVASQNTQLLGMDFKIQATQNYLPTLRDTKPTLS